MLRTSQYLFFYLLIIAVLISCKKDGESASGNLYSEWEVVGIISVESMLYSKDDNYNPIINFDENGRFTIKLDKNSCVGTYSLSGENEIKITGPGCTKICCDSDFSNKIVLMLPQVTSYSIEGNKLQLNVPGWGLINMKLQ